MKILLIGDRCKDIYYYGTVSRLSPEAPVPVLKFSHTKEHDGMAGNVYNNLKSLGADVDCYFGDNIGIKHRYIDTNTNYQLMRMDEERTSPSIDIRDVCEKFKVQEYDAIVISDYSKGAVSYKLIKDLLKLARGHVIVDTKKPDLRQFNGCIVKINENEFNHAISLTSELIVTMGGAGARYKNKTYPTDNVEVRDVTGAGDVFLATFAYYLIDTQDIEKAIVKANSNASYSCQFQGTHVI